MGPQSMSKQLETQENNPLLVTFLLGDGAFGINADLVQEVVKVSALTPVHHAPEYVLGIRNLRGRVVTVLDLRMRLDLGVSTRASENRVLIIDWQGEPIGLLVDKIADTISVASDEIETTPQNLHSVQQKNLIGVTRQGDRLVAVLNIDVVLQVSEMSE